ncbi:hypothetical protein EVAR_94846_1 [Eumeta japonica]|uniref:Uncharacterized protein n=1 Tax=Eumeta variegata TaxID=151549 RepID=A0A4C1V9M2_EUMVA|nr:hypothetical protein EVAR_94846_1 [Eumeta japonica]
MAEELGIDHEPGIVHKIESKARINKAYLSAVFHLESGKSKTVIVFRSRVTSRDECSFPAAVHTRFKVCVMNVNPNSNKRHGDLDHGEGGFVPTRQGSSNKKKRASAIVTEIPVGKRAFE